MRPIIIRDSYRLNITSYTKSFLELQVIWNDFWKLTKTPLAFLMPKKKIPCEFLAKNRKKTNTLHLFATNLNDDSLASFFTVLITSQSIATMAYFFVAHLNYMQVVLSLRPFGLTPLITSLRIEHKCKNETVTPVSPSLFRTACYYR